MDQEIVIDENKIDTMLHLLHDADPTGDHSDCDELLPLEDTCLAMGPLIEQELEEIDRRSASLAASNKKLVDALNFYQTLMKHYTALPYSAYQVPDAVRYTSSMAHHQIYGSPLPASYMSESYQPLAALSNAESFSTSLPPSGTAPSVLPCMIQSASHPHLSYSARNQMFSSIPQTSMPASSDNFPATSRDQNNVLYGSDIIVTSSSASVSLQQQPMS